MVADAIVRVMDLVVTAWTGWSMMGGAGRLKGRTRARAGESLRAREIVVAWRSIFAAPVSEDHMRQASKGDLDPLGIG
jgi:hypothetical protein